MGNKREGVKFLPNIPYQRRLHVGTDDWLAVHGLTLWYGWLYSGLLKCCKHDNLRWLLEKGPQPICNSKATQIGLLGTISN